MLGCGLSSTVKYAVALEASQSLRRRSGQDANDGFGQGGKIQIKIWNTYVGESPAWSKEKSG